MKIICLSWNISLVALTGFPVSELLSTLIAGLLKWMIIKK